MGWLGTFGLVAVAFAAICAPFAALGEPVQSRGSAEGGADANLKALLAGFASMPGLSARFHEERHIALLQEPLVSSGRLYFAPPDRLLRRVDAPVASVLFAEGGRLALSTAEESQTIDLDSHPVVRAFVDSFRLVLLGDLEGLRKIYRIEFEHRGPHAEGVWRIRLEPILPSLAGVISSIVIIGHGHVLDELRIQEVRGDRAIMHFSAVETTRAISAEELADQLRLQGP